MTKQATQKNLTLIFLFCFAVIFFIFVSFVIKAVGIIRSSTFDSKQQYNLLLSDAKNKTYIVSFSPLSKKIAAVELKGLAFDTTGKVLGVPIDDTLVISKGDSVFGQSLAADNILFDLDFLLLGSLFHLQKIQTTATVYDLARMLAFSRGIKKDSEKPVVISLPEDEKKIDKLTSEVFIDSTITQEKISIEIINGTLKSGLGSRGARFVANIGGYVIAVNTADTEIAKSEIKTNLTDSYTLERIARILRYPITKQQGLSFADITIILGKDSLSKLPF